MSTRASWIAALVLLPEFLLAAAHPQPSGEFAPAGVNVGSLSKTVRPGNDFFNYVNEGWIASTPIPEGYWDYGQTSILAANVDRQVKSLLDQSNTNDPAGSAGQEVRDAYASFLDTAAIERRGISSIRNQLRRWMASRSRESAARWMADTTSSSLFAINLFPAEGRWRVHIDQQNLARPMLGLPNPDMYRATDAKASSTRDAYRAYIAQLLALAGIDHAPQRAERVLALETQVAANLWPLEKLRDRRANYHPMTVRELIDYAPGFPWRAFLEARGVGETDGVVLGTDTAVRAQAALFAATPVQDWNSFLAFHWLQNQIDVLPQAFRDASWEFNGRTLSSAKAMPTREEIAARLVTSELGSQVGRLYAEQFVSAQTIASADELISYLRTAFAERLRNATWMDEAPRAEAQKKLARFKFKVGRPKILRDYSNVRVRRDDAAGNLRRVREGEWAYQLRRLDPATKDEPWYQTPQTVDASYSVLFNAIELPGAFLQPPYFDANADPAVNFGAIGAIVGHEMGHGFDDQGIIYDSEGRLRNWWSSTTLDEFHRRARALVDQYNGFTPLPDVHVNGERTIGENIADLSGVLLAYRAYHLFLAEHPAAEGPSADGLTGDQRFFAAWAQAWRYKAPESAIRHVVNYGYHAPTQYRVNGVVQNIDEWYAAFGVVPGDALYIPPGKRVRIW